jgi:hypothetical protein
VQAALDALELESGALVDEISGMPADDWKRSGDVDGTPRTIIDALRATVDAVAAHLRGAERAIAAARHLR